MGRYLGNQPDTTLVAMEKELSRKMAVNGVGEVTLNGRIDRVDQREALHIVLDYKTGTVKKWKRDAALQLSPAPQWEMDREGLQEIYRVLPDVQLPFYVHLFCTSENSPPSKTTAAYVEFKESGKEVFLLEPRDLEGDSGTAWGGWIEQNFPGLVEYLIRHVVYAPHWYPATDEKGCSHCDYNDMCRYAL